MRMATTVKAPTILARRIWESKDSCNASSKKPPMISSPPVISLYASSICFTVPYISPCSSAIIYQPGSSLRLKRSMTGATRLVMFPSWKSLMMPEMAIVSSKRRKSVASGERDICRIASSLRYHFGLARWLSRNSLRPSISKVVESIGYCWKEMLVFVPSGAT